MNVTDFDKLYAGYVTVYFPGDDVRPMKLLACMNTWPTDALKEANAKRDYLMDYYERQNMPIEKFVVMIYEVGYVQAGKIVMKRKPVLLQDY